MLAVLVGGNARSPHALNLALQPTDYTATYDSWMTGNPEAICEVQTKSYFYEQGTGARACHPSCFSSAVIRG